MKRIEAICAHLLPDKKENKVSRFLFVCPRETHEHTWSVQSASSHTVSAPELNPDAALPDTEVHTTHTIERRDIVFV